MTSTRPALIYPHGVGVIEKPLELAEGIWLLPLPAPFAPGYVNSIALQEAAGWTIVDTGLNDAPTKQRWAGYLASELSGAPITRIVATHHHPDHIGLAGWFQSEHGAKLLAPRTAWLFARMMQLDDWRAPPPEAEAFHLACGYDEAMMARWRKRAAVNFSKTVHPMPLGVETLSAGDKINIGARRWRIEFSQGHAPDHAVLICETDKIALVADAALPKITPNIGVYPTEPEADPLGAWLKACADLQNHIDDDMLIAPGHGAPYRGGRARLQGIIAKHRRGLDRLEAHLNAPRTVTECFSAMFRREITPMLEGLATVETIAHLHRLRAEGRASRSTRPNGVWEWSAV